MTFLDSLRERAAARECTLVFPEADEARTARAVVRLWEEGVVTPVAVGDPAAVARAISKAGGDPATIRVFDPEEPELHNRLTPVMAGCPKGKRMSAEAVAEAARDPYVAAGLLVKSGNANGAVAGAVAATATVIRAGLWTIGPDEDIRTVSSAFYMVVPEFREDGSEVLTFTDAGVIPYPDSAQLAEIAVAAARARRAVVGDEPRVAFLSYSTKGSAGGPSVDRVREALQRFREREPEVPADGELQGDAALVRSVGESKAPGSIVAGRANVLVFPDLDSGNIAYKLVQRLTGCVALGPIVQGLRRPYNDLSRGATTEEIEQVACITALMG